MGRRRTGDLRLIQELNRSIIYETIRKHGPISRSQIAKRNQISPTTVTSAVNELIKSGFVHEGKPGISSGGRKPILVHFSPDSYFIIGVSIDNSVIEIGKLNLNTKVSEKQSYPVDGRKGEDLIAYLLDLIEEFLKDIPDLDRCIGISIVTPGIVDYQSGLIRFNSFLKLKDVPLKRKVEERFHLNVWIENDSNAFALAEKEIGEYKEDENICYVSIGDGVGAGIVLNGKVFRGHGGGAAEFGHTTIERNGIPCHCGNKGCLERYVSWTAIYSRIVSEVPSKADTCMMSMTSKGLSGISPFLFMEAVEQEDPLAMNILEDVVSYLSAGIVNIVNLLNPDLVLIGGEFSNGNEILLSKVTELVGERSLHTNSGELKFGLSSLGKDAKLISAANLVLHDQFQFSLTG